VAASLPRAVATIGVNPRVWFQVVPRSRTGSANCVIVGTPRRLIHFLAVELQRKLLYPLSYMEFGMKNKLQIDAGGYAHPPQTAGIGVDFDWDFIDRSTIKKL